MLDQVWLLVQVIFKKAQRVLSSVFMYRVTQAELSLTKVESLFTLWVFSGVVIKALLQWSASLHWPNTGQVDYIMQVYNC